MIIIVQLLAFILFTQCLSTANVNRLKKTKRINFTYYYQHTTKESNNVQISIWFQKEGNNLNQLLSQYNVSYHAVKLQALKYEAFIVNDTQTNFTNSIHLQNGKYELLASLVIGTNSDDKLSQLLDSLLNISQTHNVKISQIQRISSQDINYVEQEILVQKNAQIKSETICLKYFNMKLQKILLFEKVKYNYSDNSTDQNYFVGNLHEVKQQIAKEESFLSLNSFFKCQIICENNYRNLLPQAGIKKEKDKKKLLQKLARQKKKGISKNKLKGNQEKVKKNKRIKLEDTQL